MAGEGSTARDRVIGAAAELFAEHGVKGTSLRMIADRLGVAKGAVYYQFRSKDDIVLALLEPLFDGIHTLLGTAESLPLLAQRRVCGITGLVDLAIEHRRATYLFRRDPVVDELIAQRPELHAVAGRFRALLLGPAPDDTARVSLSVVMTGLFFCTSDPALRDIADADLRETLLRCFAAGISPEANCSTARWRPSSPR